MIIARKTEAPGPSRIDKEDSTAEAQYASEYSDDERDQFLASNVEPGAAKVLLRASNVLRTETALEGYAEKAKALMRAQDPTVYDRDLVIRVVERKNKRFWGCVSLPFSIGMFMAFGFSTLLHRDIGNVYIVEAGLREELGAGLDAVNDIQSWWVWMNSTFLPKLMLQQDVTGRPLEDKGSWGRVLGYNQLQGPLAIKQLRSTRELCQDGLGIAGDMLCYPWKRLTSEPFGAPADKAVIANITQNEYAGGSATLQEREEYYASSFSCTSNCDLGVDSPLSGERRLAVDEVGGVLGSTSRKLREAHDFFKAYTNAGYFVNWPTYEAKIYPNTNYSLVQQHLNYLYDRQWLDEQTVQIGVQALLVNAEVGRPRFEFFQVFFYVNRGGSVFTDIYQQSLFMKFYAGTMVVVIDWIFVGMLIFATAVEGRLLFEHMREKRLIQHLKSLAVILRVGICVSGWALLLYIAFVQLQTSEVLKLYQHVIEQQQKDMPAEAQFQEDNGLIVNVDATCFNDANVSVGTGFFLLALMLRFFLSFSAQPRLGVVVSTLEACASDVIHLLTVIMPTFVAYAISGIFIFGRSYSAFSTPRAAFTHCFRILLEGEYDWEALAAEKYASALIWVTSFMIMMVIVLFNMLAAIILEVYGRIRSSAGQTEAVWTTIWNMCQHLRYRSEWISSADLVEGLQKFPKVITREELLDVFPFCAAQMDELFTDVRFETDLESSKSMEGQESMKMAMAVKLLMDKINTEVTSLHEATDIPGDSFAFDKQAPHPGEDDFKSEAFKSEPESGASPRRLQSCDTTTRSVAWLRNIAKEMSQQNHKMLSIQWQMQQLQWQWQAVEALYGPEAVFDVPTDFQPPPLACALGRRDDASEAL